MAAKWQLEIRRIEQLLEAHARLNEAQQQGDEQSRKVASADLDRRLHSMNMLREQLIEERGEYLQRSYYDVNHQALEMRLRFMETLVSNLQGRILAVGGVMSTVVVIINVALHFLRR